AIVFLNFLVSVRIHTLTSEVLLKEEKSLSEIVASPKINIEESLQHLHYILEFLTGLPVGQYFLSHQKGEKIMTLYKAHDTTHRGAFDLHTTINQKLSTLDDYQEGNKGELRWLPLDPEVILPEFQQQKRIPVTFPPKPTSVYQMRSVQKKKTKALFKKSR
ncbi:little elongation complex subunit 2-like, partial [Limulus polyphemus]|uniref:Little elongation complex subunit 2-like n=1 Tax=Limulus polyphemus TaxID=6850 RepID=A0ABM1BWX4_LIMPO